MPREPLSEEVATTQPVTPFELDPLEFLLCLRAARRGAAPGPSGMTSDHLFPLLESDHDSDLFCQVGSLLATGNIPTEALEGLRLGRFNACARMMGASGALSLVTSCGARSMAKPNKQHQSNITFPICSECERRQGGECVAHVLQLRLCPSTVWELMTSFSGTP